MCPTAAVAFGKAGPDFLLLDDGVQVWKNSKQFTIEVAEKIFADQYSFKATTPAEMSFGTWMVHIATLTVFRFAQTSGVKPPFPIIGLEKKQLTKDDITKMLAQSFDFAIELIPKMTTDQLNRELKVDWRGRSVATGRQMLLNMFTHVAHHRAQPEVYLRLKGIEPPFYTF